MVFSRGSSKSRWQGRSECAESDAALPVGLLAELRERQVALAEQVRVKDDFAPLRHVAGVDVGFENEGHVTRAGVVVLRWPSLETVEVRVARLPTSFPYIPGFLSFREMPALLEAWQSIRTRVELVFVDGLGIAHPRRLGVASHLGVELDIPTIGVAKSRLVGEHADVAPTAGSAVPLSFRGVEVGAVLRSKVRCNPLYVSPGHRVSVPTALRLVRDALRGYRLPEPTRLADRVTSARTRDTEPSH